VPVEIDPLFNERRLGQWNNRPIAETEELLAAKVTPPGGESEADFESRISLALDNLKPIMDRRPLLVSSKGVGRIMNVLLGGPGRMQVGNGEIVEFNVARAHDGMVLKVARPHQL
jgi:probable phosphoglycerate mutase